MIRGKTKGNIISRSTRFATLMIYNHTLLAKALVSVSNFASPQAAKLKRWIERGWMRSGLCPTDKNIEDSSIELSIANL